MEIGAEAVENGREVSLKTMELPHNPAIPLLSTYLGKAKTLIKKHTCTAVFITALFYNSQDMETI